MGEATYYRTVKKSNSPIFQSTLPVGEATGTMRGLACRTWNFNPRFPWGKRRHQRRQARRPEHYFNPRFPWGKRPGHCWQTERPRKISIHASRGGSDSGDFELVDIREISIHASRGGSDSAPTTSASICQIFQSTLPVGEATAESRFCLPQTQNFNPRFPWGKRPIISSRNSSGTNFNPRFPWGKRPIGPQSCAGIA